MFILSVKEFFWLTNSFRFSKPDLIFLDHLFMRFYCILILFFLFPFFFEYGVTVFLGYGFIDLLFGQLLERKELKYFGKNMLVFIVFIIVFGLYHFLGYTEELWCNVLYRGFLVMVILFSLILV